MTPTTEAESNHKGLDSLSTAELLEAMNSEDLTVPQAVAKALPAIEALTDAVIQVLQAGRRIFYIGAGTSGRLGVVDASELPPTFGVDASLFIGLIAGGDSAIRKAVEFAEDNTEQATLDIQSQGATAGDMVIGIAASGRTPYVVGGLKEAKKAGMRTGCIVCNTGSAVASEAEFPVEVVVGPEFVTGSTRLKAGTAQKLVLNMISTVAMIRIGRVKGNKMVNMQLTNHKLVDRGVRMLQTELGLEPEEAAKLLQQYGSVAGVIAARTA
jgi:N-acetylmuramic acid 6-phosphate etherase